MKPFFFFKSPGEAVKCFLESNDFFLQEHEWHGDAGTVGWRRLLGALPDTAFFIPCPHVLDAFTSSARTSITGTTVAATVAAAAAGTMLTTLSA